MGGGGSSEEVGGAQWSEGVCGDGVFFFLWPKFSLGVRFRRALLQTLIELSELFGPHRVLCGNLSEFFRPLCAKAN